jgi:hypothetical protein
LFTALGGKFKFSAQDSDLEYLFWQRKNSPVSSDLKPPLNSTANPAQFGLKLSELAVLFVVIIRTIAEKY